MAYVDVRGPIHVADVSAAIESLLSRHAGLDLYHDAMRLDRSVARFRELWRFLESAFGRQDAELVELLADYEPAKEMDFTKAELENLRTLRGRASHAASKAGFAELQAVNMQVNAAIARLNSLARHVLLTKKTWGQATTGVERIARTGWVGP